MPNLVKEIKSFFWKCFGFLDKTYLLNENLIMESYVAGHHADGYNPQNSKVLEARVSEARGLIDPLTKKIPWENLPRNSRMYTFGVEVLPYLSGAVKVRLLIEHKMACGGAGHCRRVDDKVSNFLEGQVGYGLGSWEHSEDYTSLSKHRVAPNYHTDMVDIFHVEPDTVLEQWLGHYRKFLEKQVKKAGRLGVNLGNIPYSCGPKEVKDGVESLLGWKGCVFAIDPSWRKDVWEHDGTVTVYVPKVAANDLVQKCREGLLTLSPKTGSTKKVIKAWIDKSLLGGASGSSTLGGQGSQASQGSMNESDAAMADMEDIEGMVGIAGMGETLSEEY